MSTASLLRAPRAGSAFRQPRLDRSAVAGETRSGNRERRFGRRRRSITIEDQIAEGDQIATFDRVPALCERKFLAVARLYEQLGMGSIRVLTDVSAERYWTVVSEIEVESLEAYRTMEKDPRAARKMEQIMEGYHDLVDHGRREIYAIESQAA